MKQKYDAYETAFAVGTKLTFPAPTACSTSDVVAGHFMNGIQLVIHKAGGVALVPGQLSAYDESEVMLPFPSTFKVIARSKVQDTVVVMIEAVPTSFSYCSAPEGPSAPAQPTQCHEKREPPGKRVAVRVCLCLQRMRAGGVCGSRAAVQRSCATWRSCAR